MRKSFVILILLLFVSPVAGLAATGVEPGEVADVAAADQGAPSAIISAPLLDLVGQGGVAQAGCSDFTPCETADDCPCPAPECACVPISGCRGFDHICLCYTYCFGGSQP
ncbi:MAG: hypothetical protein PVG07_06935 [Acidobacteriota bacterium]